MAERKSRTAVQVIRVRLAQLVWLAAVLCALFLAVGALLIALDANRDNTLVQFVLDVADVVDLDVFSREDGIFTYSDQTKAALVNWGLAAIGYLVVGRIVERIIRP